MVRNLVGSMIVVVLAGLPAASHAQPAIPVEALAAEGREDWAGALRLYGDLLRQDSTRVDLWLRVADIYARHGQTRDTIWALESAIDARKDDADLYARLSRAYAVAGQPKAALAAIQGALALVPDDVAYLRACGELASWSGDYPTAREAYRRVLEQAADDPQALLGVARSSAWDGATDQAAAAYRRYLHLMPEDAAVWLEAARTESWRGNDAAAMARLESYRTRAGESDAYRWELASVLTRARRPAQAIGVLRPLVATGSNDYDINWLHALAQTEYGAARSAQRAFDSVLALDSERPETSNLARQLRIAFGSLVQPSGTAYGDSDGLRSYRVPLSVSIAAAPGVRVQVGYERQELSARVGSGLERIDGGRAETLDRGWAGAELRPWAPLVLRVHGGRQDSSVRQEGIYGAGLAWRVSDELRVEYDREHSLMTISPRAVSLGLLRDHDRLRAGWTPTFSFAVDVEASREALSDSNERLAFRAAPRIAVVRNQWLNLDAGASVYLLSAQRNLENGYYDPSRYEAYSFTLLPYFKFSENYGLSLFLEGGAQKDDSASGFEPGGSAAAELTMGIYRPWMLKFSGSATLNSRLESGAFRGYSGAIVLVRRF